MPNSQIKYDKNYLKPSMSYELLATYSLVYKCSRFYFFFLYYRSAVVVFFCLSLLCLLCHVCYFLLCLCSVFFAMDPCGLN